MSTQLCSGPSPEPKDVHPFIDAAMLQVKLIAACALCLLVFLRTLFMSKFGMRILATYSSAGQFHSVLGSSKVAAKFCKTTTDSFKQFTPCFL